MSIEWYHIILGDFTGYFGIDTTTNVIQQFCKSGNIGVNILSSDITNTNGADNTFFPLVPFRFTANGTMLTTLSESLDMQTGAIRWQIKGRAKNSSELWYLTSADGVWYNYGAIAVLFTPIGRTQSIVKTQNLIISQQNIYNAVNIWCSDLSIAVFWYGPISGWDTTSVTDMVGLFLYQNTFNDDISQWNTANVSDMTFMFNGAATFDKDLSSWHVPLIPVMPLSFTNGLLVPPNFGEKPVYPMGIYCSNLPPNVTALEFSQIGTLYACTPSNIIQIDGGSAITFAVLPDMYNGVFFSMANVDSSLYITGSNSDIYKVDLHTRILSLFVTIPTVIALYSIKFFGGIFYVIAQELDGSVCLKVNLDGSWSYFIRNLNNPYTLDIDNATSNVYIADLADDQISKIVKIYDINGIFIRSFHTHGRGIRIFENILYVTDQNLSMVRSFNTTDGTVIDNNVCFGGGDMVYSDVIGLIYVLIGNQVTRSSFLHKTFTPKTQDFLNKINANYYKDRKPLNSALSIIEENYYRSMMPLKSALSSNESHFSMSRLLFAKTIYTQTSENIQTYQFYGGKNRDASSVIQRKKVLSAGKPNSIGETTSFQGSNAPTNVTQARQRVRHRGLYNNN